MTSLFLKGVAICCLAAIPAAADLCHAKDFFHLIWLLRGGKVLAQNDENTYLGKITNKYDSESIFSEHGPYGSSYYANSLWNRNGEFGSKYGPYSAFNSNSSKPPMIIKEGKIVGYITTNKWISGGCSPNLLKALSDKV